MATWTTTEQTVTWTAVDDPSVTWAVNVNPTVVGGGGAVDSVNGDTGVVVLTATDVGAQRVGTAPVVVANGGTIPAGTSVALLQGATATLPAASSHGLGQEITLTCIGGVDCVLSATGSDLLAAGSGLTIDKDYSTKVAAADISALAFPGALNWGITATAFQAAAAQALLTGYALSADVTTEIDSVADASDLADQRQAHADELLAGITNVFRGDLGGNGRWSTPSLTAGFTTGISYRCLRIPRRPPTLPFYAEYFTQPHDSGAGSWDNFEGADFWPALDDAQLVGGKPYNFHEQTESGGTEDGSGWWPDLLLASDQAIETMTDITFGTGVGRSWLRVPYELDDGGTYHTDADDGAVFRLMSTFTSAKFESISQNGDGGWVAEDWWIGNNYSGDIARVIVRDGLDGTLIADPDASLVTPGATSFVDGAGNTWTAGSAAQVVALDQIDAERPVVGGQDEGPAVTATTATTLLDAAIPLASDTPGDHFTVSFGGQWLNNSGTTKTFTITVLIGSTTVATLAPVSAISSSGTPRYFRGVIDIRVNGATDINVIADGQVGTSFFPVSLGSASEDIGAGVDLDVRGAVQSGGSQELQLTQVTVARLRT